MKRITFILSLLLLAQISFAQIFSWGVKGGVNSSKISFSDINIDKAPQVDINNSEVFNYINDQIAKGNIIYTDGILTMKDGAALDIPLNVIDVKAPELSFSPSSYEMGFHFGAFARLKILGVFLQPELIFSQTNAALDLNPEGFDASKLANQVTSSKITYNNFDVPVMLGVKLGPAHLCAGPVATFKLSSGFDDATKEFLKEIESEEDLDVFTVTKNATFGAQVGAGLTILKKVTVDVRYEFGLSKLGDQVTLGGKSFNTDQRGSQFIGSVGIMF
jgi:hypothetical protein